jgi:hypothetical protein
VVTGEVIPQGAETEYVVEYGTTAALGASTSPVDAGSAMTGVYTTVALEGLQPDTTYSYRFAASNSGGEGRGTIEALTTNISGDPSSTLPSGFSLTQTGTPLGNPAPVNFPNLTSLSPSLPARRRPSAKVKPPTRAEKLTRALDACKKDVSHKTRQSCEKQAKEKYGPKGKKGN